MTFLWYLLPSGLLSPQYSRLVFIVASIPFPLHKLCFLQKRLALTFLIICLGKIITQGMPIWQQISADGLRSKYEFRFL